MPRTNFTTSTPITSEFLNKVARPRISTLDEDGAIPPISNDGLDNQPGSLLYDFYDYVDSFQVSRAASPLTVTVKGGAIRLPTGESLSVPQTNLPVPDNSISFISYGQGGLVSTTVRPTFGYVMASVQTVNGSITNITDLRVSASVSPQATIIDTFGGQNPNDVTVAAGQTVTMSGSVECRNFFLPANSILRVDNSLVIRASGDVTLLGNIATAYQINRPPYTNATLGGFTTENILISGDRVVDSAGNPHRSRRKNRLYNGLLVLSARTSSTNSSHATFFGFATTLLNFNSAANGGDFTVNAAGRIVVGSNVDINMNPLQPSKPTSLVSAAVVGSGHPTTGLLTTNWSGTIEFSGSQGVAGTITLQSPLSISIGQGSRLLCRGSNEGFAYRFQTTQAGLVSEAQPFGNNYFKPGAGGGGGIWIHSPVISNHPSVIFDVAAGFQSTPSPTNLFLNGVGSVGKGYTDDGTSSPVLNSSTEAKPGTLTINYGYPVEF